VSRVYRVQSTEYRVHSFGTDIKGPIKVLESLNNEFMKKLMPHIFPSSTIVFIYFSYETHYYLGIFSSNNCKCRL
jgi:hypothetical protein